MLGHYFPYVWGYTRATIAWYNVNQYRKVEEITKASLSSDWGLQLDLMKLKSLVIANQQCRGEYVLGFCTHRPSNHGSW